MLHQVQGGYYVKGFSKHGPLHNAHTYGYFEHVPYKGFKGGHVTCGGIVYQGGAYPEKYNNQYVAGNLLSNALYWHVLEPKGSSFTARHGGDFLVANDTWFRPVDCLTGPDGAVYVADWYDKRANHVDPVDNWDRSNGRIYKVEVKGAKGLPKIDLRKLSSKELVKLLDHPNGWYAGEARRLLAERRDATVVPLLRQDVAENKGRLALESLWALYVSGGFDETFAEKSLGHANPDVRAWTVRFLGDAKKVSPPLRKRLVELARAEPSPTVRSQLACSCKRLPGADCLPIVRELLHHKEDVDDPHIPLLLWWAVEDKAVAHRDLVLGLLEKPADWQAPLMQRFLVERLARRYLAEGTGPCLSACARLLEAAPGPGEVALLVRGMEKALEGRRLDKVPAALEKPLERLYRGRPDDLTLLRLAVRLGVSGAYDRAVQRVADAKTPERDRVLFLELLGQAGQPDCVPLLLQVLTEARTDALRGAALSALQAFPDRRIPERVLALYPKLSTSLRGRAVTLLCGRPASTLALLEAVDAGRVAPKDVPLAQLQQMALLKDAKLHKLLEKHWGKVGPATSGEKQSRIRSLAGILRQGTGDRARGKVVFTKTCAVCHTLFGEGTKIGPDLTGADRKNRDWLITHIVDPNAVIRPEYVAYLVHTKDGRSLTGLVAESSASAVTLVDAKNERTVIARTKIEQMTPSPVSLMPEKLLDEFDDRQLRDLFSYVQGDGPVK
jgi:putative heme-binding domain-containing protein